MTGGIVLGIVAGLQVGVALGHPIAVSTQALTLGPVVAQFVGATVISAAFALSAYAGLATVVLAGLMGALGWAGYLGMVTLGFGEVTANSAGALLAAFVATIIARRFRTPGFALIAAAILPLVPGLSLFTGLLQAVGSLGQPADLAASGVTLLQALGVAVGIAAGATLGTYFGRPVEEQLRRIRNLPRPGPGRSRRSPSEQAIEPMNVGLELNDNGSPWPLKPTRPEKVGDIPVATSRKATMPHPTFPGQGFSPTQGDLIIGVGSVSASSPAPSASARSRQVVLMWANRSGRTVLHRGRVRRLRRSGGPSYCRPRRGWRRHCASGRRSSGSRPTSVACCTSASTRITSSER